MKRLVSNGWGGYIEVDFDKGAPLNSVKQRDPAELSKESGGTLVFRIETMTGPLKGRFVVTGWQQSGDRTLNAELARREVVQSAVGAIMDISKRLDVYYNGEDVTASMKTVIGEYASRGYEALPSLLGGIDRSKNPLHSTRARGVYGW